MATKTTSVNFKLKNELNELFTDVSHLIQLPKVRLFNDAIEFYLNKLIKDNSLDEELTLLKEAREKRKKKK